MNNITNKLFIEVANFAEVSNAIANAADNLLSYVLPKDNSAASVCYRVLNSCGACQRISRYVGTKRCKRCCLENRVPVRKCRPYNYYCNPGV